LLVQVPRRERLSASGSPVIDSGARPRPLVAEATPDDVGSWSEITREGKPLRKASDVARSLGMLG
jgi:hypothetical protein